MVSILTILAGMLAGFFAISKMMLTQATKDRESDRKERKEFSDAIKEMAKASKMVAAETKKGNEEARIRNGHLGEQNIQIAELVKSSKEDMLKAVHNVKVQHVEKQTVDREIVKSKK
ncbi:hypothetical protein [Caudoviricetes sp.]|nr:hypothetical protein [Caudoviricetes sp.]